MTGSEGDPQGQVERVEGQGPGQGEHHGHLEGRDRDRAGDWVPDQHAGGGGV